MSSILLREAARWEVEEVAALNLGPRTVTNRTVRAHAKTDSIITDTAGKSAEAGRDRRLAERQLAGG